MHDLDAEHPDPLGPRVEALTLDRPTAVVGDIHGDMDLLRRLLARLGDRALLVVGDIVDRGPDVAAVVQLLAERAARGVQGNHEGWLTRWFAGGALDPAALTSRMGGRATLASWGVEPDDPDGRERVPPAHRAWLASLPVALDLTVGEGRWWLVHAGVPTTVDLRGLVLADVVPHLARTQPQALLWPQQDPDDTLPVDRPVVMGHVPQRRARDLGHVIALDTGSGRAGGALSALLLPERRLVTVGG